MGVYAVNHYAREPSKVFYTEDCDVFVRPDPRNLGRALDALKRARYELTAGGEPLPWPDPLVARRLVEHRALVRAFRERSLTIDLMLDAPLPFSALRRRRRFFRVGGIRIPCASLTHLLACKQKAGRPKDLEFLRLYESGFRSEQREARGIQQGFKPPRRSRKKPTK